MIFTAVTKLEEPSCRRSDYAVTKLEDPSCHRGDEA